MAQSMFTDAVAGLSDEFVMTGTVTALATTKDDGGRSSSRCCRIDARLGVSPSHVLDVARALIYAAGHFGAGTMTWTDGSICCGQQENYIVGTDQAVPSLMFMTLGIALAVAVAALLYFRRRRSNRHPMEGKTERNVGKEIDEGRRGDKANMP